MIATRAQTVSVIIPVYNVEQYIAICLDSILHQTYSNIQIIIVDDGSTDRSPMIADEYASKDERITVIHKKNGGLSDARNVGIDRSTGDYIMFLDSDDYVDHRFIEASLENIKNYDADIACFRFTYVDDTSEIKLSSVSSSQDFQVYSNIEGIKDIFTLGGTLKVNAWNKIYRRQLFFDNNIKYPIGRLYEDNLTTYRLMFFAKKIIYFNESLLSYRQRQGSIMKNRLTTANIKQRVGMVDETIGWLSPRISAVDLRDIKKIYLRTLTLVMLRECFVKKQPLMFIVVISEFIKSILRK